MDEREEVLATVASLYYSLDQSQSDIARRLGVSTSKISRMLKEARDSGIVEIRIRTPIPRDILLEQALIDAFELRDAIVLLSGTEREEETRQQALGEIAATWLKRALPNLPPHATIGVAWGSTIYDTVAALPNLADQSMDVVQLMGGVGTHSVDGPDITRILAAKLGGRPFDLHAPAFVERASAREVIIAEPAVRDALGRARDVKLALIGIGAVQDKNSAVLRAGMLQRADLANLRAQGAVGEIMGRFYRADGDSSGLEINDHVIGLDLDDLRTLPITIAVARGPAKVDAIHGALRGQMVNVIATDDATARAVLELADEHNRKSGIKPAHNHSQL